MITYDYAQRKRTEGTVFAIKELIKDIDIDKFISESFIIAETEEANTLIKKYEAFIIKCLLDNSYFEKTHEFLLETAKEIINKNMVKEFADFSYILYKGISLKDKTSDSLYLGIYQNLIYQQYTYLSPPHKFIYGFKENGGLMVMDEIYPKHDYPVYEIEERKIRTKEEVERIFKSYGFGDMESLERSIHEERAIVNTALQMSPFINEGTLDMVPKRFYNPTKGISILREWKSTDNYVKMIAFRRFVLPSSGVLAIYKNTGDIRALFLKEVFTEDGVFLLYRIDTVHGKGLYGLYDIDADFFFSSYRDSNGSRYHDFIKNFVLETYAHLTTDVEIDRKRIAAMKVVEDISENHFVRPDEIFVQFLIKEKDKKDESRERGFRSFNRDSYIKSEVNISPYIRILPEGATASEEAIVRAKKYGYELKEGETFIRAFKRSNYKLKE